MRGAIEHAGGYIFQVIGDAFCAAFHKAGDGLHAAIQAQQDLQNEPWGTVAIRVRMGIHTGEAEPVGEEYRGYLALSLVQRVMSAGHGGQVLISDASERLLRDALPPSSSLRDMGAHTFKGTPFPVRLFQVVAPGLLQEFPPLRTPDTLPNNLPVQITSFVGREKQLADVKNLLQDAHLLTLMGPGGTGKTRLSIRAASELLDYYPAGVWLVELAPILDPLLVPRTTAIAIGLRDEPQRPVIDMLCDYLKDKKMLILLDNCEHLVDACARMADRILRGAPDVRILASSREPLAIAGEVTYRVPSLGLPDLEHLPSVETLSQYEAVKLFIDRALAALPSFTVSNENAPALAEICHHLDGIPLAIELAAAKVRVLSLEQIAARLGDRFRLLTGGSRTALERHQTLRATIDWSYNLLPPSEQVLFRRLSVFVGGWTLEAAESVCAGGSVSSEDILALLEQLINKSVVITVELPGRTRYHMLETLRQYANEKLVESGESDALRDRHLEYFLSLAEAAEPHLIRSEQSEWLTMLDADHDNLRLALEWSLGRETAIPSLKLCRALGFFWNIRCYWLEGLKWLGRALARPAQGESRGAKLARVRAMPARFHLEWQLGNFDQLPSLAKEGFALAMETGDKRDIAIAKFQLGVGLGNLGEDLENAIPSLEQSLAEFQELDEPFWHAFSFTVLGFHLANQTKLKYRDYHLKSLELARKAGDRLTLADALYEYAVWLFHSDRVLEAKERAEESEGLYKEIGYGNGSLNSFVFAWIAWLEGDYPKAKALFTELQERYALLGVRWLPIRTRSYLGLIAMDEGNLDRAQAELEYSLALARDTGWEVHIALRLSELSSVYYRQRKLEEFKRAATQSLVLKRDFYTTVKPHLLIAILCSLCFQKPESSARLLGALDRYAGEYDYPPGPLDMRSRDRAEAQARKSLGEAAFAAAFAEGQKLSLDEALDLASRAVAEIN